MDRLRKYGGAVLDLSRFLDLTKEGSASTFIRLFKSRHVADLRSLSLIVVIFVVASTPLIILLHEKHNDSLIGSPTVVAGIIAIALGAIARIYQMGSLRLGVVDLFSCEITTICRVFVVSDSARAFVALYDKPPRTAKRFTSEENYSPIFNSSARDLENLEARVVECVTEFYTYLKTMRDYLRNLAVIEHPDESIDAWQVSVRNTIYMLFLMLESARKAVDQLVEYQPEWALYIAEILLSEIIVYGFLWDSYRKDLVKNPEYDARFKRLNLRSKDYQPIVVKLNKLAALHTGTADPDREAWDKVAALLNELNRCSHSVFDELMSAKVQAGATDRERIGSVDEAIFRIATPDVGVHAGEPDLTNARAVAGITLVPKD